MGITFSATVSALHQRENARARARATRGVMKRATGRRIGSKSYESCRVSASE